MAIGANRALMTDENLTQSVLEGSLSAEELFQLAENKSAEGRKALFVTISDLFFNNQKVLSDRERALMGEILRQLVHDVEMLVRRSLSERLAKMPDAPHDLVATLADDEIEVAHSILIDSDVLQDSDLIEIIHQRTMQHQLAVSMRKSVSEDVAQALVDTGNEDVITSLLENHGAVISHEVMEYLVSESKRVDRYQNPLVQRPDLPTDLAQRMYWWVSAALRKHIVTNFAIDIAALDDEIESVTQDVIAKESQSTQGSEEIEALVDRLSELGELTSHFLIKSLRQGEVMLFELGLARLCGLRAKLLRRILYEPGGEGLAILCKALGFERQMFGTVYELTRKAVDSAAGDVPVEQAYTFFDKAKQMDASRVLKRWQRSSEYLYALKRTQQTI